MFQLAPILGHRDHPMCDFPFMILKYLLRHQTGIANLSSWLVSISCQVVYHTYFMARHTLLYPNVMNADLALSIRTVRSVRAPDQQEH